jgi:hypothetical protein
MARRYTAGTISSGAGTSARPIGSLFAVASRGGYLREVGAFNTTTTGLTIRLARCTVVGTPGTGLTENYWNTNDDAPDMTAFDTHSADATVTAGAIRYARLAASAGSGVIWTFEHPGLYISGGTNNGIGIVPDGTGQVLSWYMDWVE